MSLMALYLIIANFNINFSCSIPTFAEKLRRKDAEVAKALEEKERLIADILHIPPPLSSTSLDVYGRASSSGDIENPFDDPSGALDIQHQMSDKDATKVLLAALEQGKIYESYFLSLISLSIHKNLVFGYTATPCFLQA